MRITWVRVREAWLTVSLVVAVGLQDSTSAERVERERGREGGEREGGGGGSLGGSSLSRALFHPSRGGTEL